MITKVKGSVLDATGFIVHCVNCQGVMGSGVAKAIRERWPIVFDRYEKVSAPYLESGSNPLMLGKIQMVEVGNTQVVVNLFGQLNYGGGGGTRYMSYDAFDTGFKTFASHFVGEKEKVAVNFPLLGAVLAGGEWSIISSIIEHHLPDDTFVKTLYVL